MFGMIVMKRTLKIILTMTTITKNKILWMITLTILKMLTMTMIYQQDLMTIIENRNKSNFFSKGFCNGDKENADNSKIVVW